MLLTKFNCLHATPTENIFTISESTSKLSWDGPVANRLPHRNVNEYGKEEVTRLDKHCSSPPLEAQSRPITLNLLPAVGGDLNAPEGTLRKPRYRSFSIVKTGSSDQFDEAGSSQLRQTSEVDLDLNLTLKPPSGGKVRLDGMSDPVAKGYQRAHALRAYDNPNYSFPFQETISTHSQGKKAKKDFDDTISISSSNSPTRGYWEECSVEDQEVQQYGPILSKSKTEKKRRFKQMILEDFLNGNKNAP